MVARELGQQREIGRSLRVGRRHRHQPADRQIRRARRLEQGRELVDRATTLLRFVSNIDLEKAGRAATLSLHRAGERGDEGRAVDRMDRVEQGDRILGLVRLQLPNQVQRDVRERRA